MCFWCVLNLNQVYLTLGKGRVEHFTSQGGHRPGGVRLQRAGARHAAVETDRGSARLRQLRGPDPAAPGRRGDVSAVAAGAAAARGQPEDFHGFRPERRPGRRRHPQLRGHRADVRTLRPVRAPPGRGAAAAGPVAGELRRRRRAAAHGGGRGGRRRPAEELGPLI